VVVHNGSYSYDGGGRLAQVVDSATNQTEVYVWNGDGTLASAPGPGYTRGFVWNEGKGVGLEEGQLVGIEHNGVLVYQYGYGADGNRRWRKDLVNNVWVWYPCGVACIAGELVEEVSDLSGGVWKVQALYLRAGGGCSSLLVRRNGEYHHGDVLGNKGVITDGSGNVLSSNEGKGVGLEYDAFGVSMFTSGSAQTPWRLSEISQQGDDTLIWQGSTVILNSRMLYLQGATPSNAPADYCERGTLTNCKGSVTGISPPPSPLEFYVRIAANLACRQLASRARSVDTCQNCLAQGLALGPCTSYNGPWAEAVGVDIYDPSRHINKHYTVTCLVSCTLTGQKCQCIKPKKPPSKPRPPRPIRH